MKSPRVTSAHLSSSPVCYPSASGGPVLECEAPVPTLRDGLAEVIRYACTRSDSLSAAVRALGLASPTVLRRLARTYGVKLPWRTR